LLRDFLEDQVADDSRLTAPGFGRELGQQTTLELIQQRREICSVAEYAPSAHCIRQGFHRHQRIPLSTIANQHIARRPWLTTADE